MLRLHPSSIILTGEEVTKVLEQPRPARLESPSTSSIFTWDHDLVIRRKRKGKQRASTVISEAYEDLADALQLALELDGVSGYSGDTEGDLVFGEDRAYAAGSVIHENEFFQPHDILEASGFDSTPSPPTLSSPVAEENSSDKSQRTASGSIIEETLPLRPDAPSLLDVYEEWDVESPIENQLYSESDASNASEDTEYSLYPLARHPPNFHQRDGVSDIEAELPNSSPPGFSLRADELVSPTSTMIHMLLPAGARRPRPQSVDSLHSSEPSNLQDPHATEPQTGLEASNITGLTLQTNPAGWGPRGYRYRLLRALNLRRRRAARSADDSMSDDSLDGASLQLGTEDRALRMREEAAQRTIR